MNFISCVKWVKQGVSKNVPDVIHFSEEELREIIEGNENSSKLPDESIRQEATSGDEFDFSNYDNEDGAFRANVQSVVAFEEKRKKKKNKKSNVGKRKQQSNDDDSDAEDERIKDDDNLILVGLVDGDFNSLNVYVFNENDGDMYVHHDLILKSSPLCVEWLNASNISDSDNLCAIGEMEPVIGIWDLDIVNCIEPIFKLGRAKRKNPSKNYGHTDSVLSLAWNIELPHILCSGSVDGRGLLWDLHSGKVDTELTVFKDKVQAVLWNPRDPYSLLTGCADKYFRNFDCRVYDQYQRWKLNAAVECILPHSNNEYQCFAGTEDGMIYCIDYRQKKPIFYFTAHDKEVTGLGMDRDNPDNLISISADEDMRFWNLSKDCELIHSKNLKLGSLYTMDMNPDYPFLTCVGGSQQGRTKKILKVLNTNNIFEPKENQSSSYYSSVDELFDVPLLEDNDQISVSTSQSVTKKPKPVKKKKKKMKLSKQ